MLWLAKYISEMVFKQNIFQTTLAVLAQHNKRLSLWLNVITFCTIIVLQKTCEYFWATPGGWTKEMSQCDASGLCCNELKNLPFLPLLRQPSSLHLSFLFSVSIKLGWWLSSKKNEKTHCSIHRLCFGRFRMYTVLYKQSAQNNCLTCQPCNVTARSKSLQTHLSEAGCYIEAKVIGGCISLYSETWQVCMGTGTTRQCVVSQISWLI